MASLTDRLLGGRSVTTGAAMLGGAAAAAGALYWYLSRTPSPPTRQAVIAAIGTANPPHCGTNEQFRAAAHAMGYPADVLDMVDKVIDRAGIEARHTAVASSPEDYVAIIKSGGRARSAIWEEWAPKLAVSAARVALSRWAAGSARDVTHVVVHSCTGFSAPGIDFALITELGLASTTRKVPVNFAGCFGGFSGLYVAKQIVEADPTGRAVVLVACAEVCSVHINNDPRLELVIGNTIFADGAGAAIVANAGFVGHPRAGPAPAPDAPGVPLGGPGWEWALGSMLSDIVPDSAHSMTWKNSAEAGRFDMWLDKTIPRVLSGMFVGSGFSFIRRAGIANPFTCAWAIHPGGSSIIKAFRSAFDSMGIKGDGLADSTEVLRANGNMSSATIFFVLERVLGTTHRKEVFAAGFGPGLTIEYGRMFRVARGAGAPAVALSAAPAGAGPDGAAAAAGGGSDDDDAASERSQASSVSAA